MTSDANTDYERAYDWHEESRAGSGIKFEQAVRRCLEGLAANPLMHQKVFGNIRRGFVRDFTYVIIYEHVASENAVVVYSVFHTSQDPEIWKQRVR